jgi:transcriptional regulator with XRE-family HTH domain
MADVPVSQRLNAARKARREDLPTLAKRIGVREEHLRAIEQGRFADLPPGIYGRAAIRSFATAFGFDPAEFLAECESQLTPVAEPIHAIGKLRGVRQPARPAAVASAPVTPNAEGLQLPHGACPDWRLLAAATLDTGVVVALLLFVVVCAITTMMVPLAALDHSGPAFGLMGLLLGSAYFVWFGGLGGRTFGEQLFQVEPKHAARASMTLRAIGSGALLAATDDARFIQGLGAWAGNVAHLRSRSGGPGQKEGRPLLLPGSTR